MPADRPGTRLAKAYETARASTLKNEHRKLSAKEFLDTVDPAGKRSVKSARDYLRRVAKGERGGSQIVKRADQGGGQYLVVFKRKQKNAEGQTIERETSAIVRVPKGKSNLGIYQQTRLSDIRKAANEYATARTTQGYQPPTTLDQKPIVYDRHWKIATIRPLRQTGHTAAIVRHHV